MTESSSTSASLPPRYQAYGLATLGGVLYFLRGKADALLWSTPKAEACATGNEKKRQQSQNYQSLPKQIHAIPHNCMKPSHKVSVAQFYHILTS